MKGGIKLTQVEKGDISILESLSLKYSDKLPSDRYLNIVPYTEEYATKVNDEKSINFVLRVRKSDKDFTQRVVGFCSLKSIDWVNKHAEIEFLMQDGIHSATMPNTELGAAALELLLKHSFEELGFQKLWIEVLATNEIMSILDNAGFNADGIRRKAWFKKGKFIDSKICSILQAEFL